jgi:hypothetical protein
VADTAATTAALVKAVMTILVLLAL